MLCYYGLENAVKIGGNQPGLALVVNCQLQQRLVGRFSAFSAPLGLENFCQRYSDRKALTRIAAFQLIQHRVVLFVFISLILDWRLRRIQFCI